MLTNPFSSFSALALSTVVLSTVALSTVALSTTACERGANGARADLRAESATGEAERAASETAPRPGLASSNGRVPVVVELFSSEGCSSCPRADEVLRGLEHDQPIDGAEIIAMELHVDYWNDLGWVDPFSKPEFTARQRGYAAALGTESIFTPEAVIDGRASTVGSRAGAVIDEVHQAAEHRHLKMSLAPSGRALSLSIDDAPDANTSLFLAVTEAGLSTKVEAGENAGHTLRHAPIVRSLTRLGEAASGTRSIDVPRVDARPGTLVAVVFAQVDRGPIVGAATVALDTSR